MNNLYTSSSKRTWVLVEDGLIEEVVVETEDALGFTNGNRDPTPVEVSPISRYTPSYSKLACASTKTLKCPGKHLRVRVRIRGQVQVQEEDWHTDVRSTFTTCNITSRKFQSRKNASSQSQRIQILSSDLMPRISQVANSPTWKPPLDSKQPSCS